MLHSTCRCKGEHATLAALWCARPGAGRRRRAGDVCLCGECVERGRRQDTNGGVGRCPGGVGHVGRRQHAT
eukprot:615470-Prymnesium_polylepis.1